MNKVLLMILDGWGIGKHDKTDAIFNTPTSLYEFIVGKISACSITDLWRKCRFAGWPDG